MSEERKMILKMLEEGKITADEANKLLEALEEKRLDESDDILQDSPKVDKFFDNIGDFVRKTVQSAVNTFTPNGNDLDFNGEEFFQEEDEDCDPEEVPHKRFTTIKNIPDNAKEIHLEMQNAKTYVRKSDRNYSYIKISSDSDDIENMFRADQSDNYFALIERTAEEKKVFSFTVNTFMKNYKYIVELCIDNEKQFEKIKLSNDYGPIELRNLNAKNITAYTDYGKIVGSKICAEDLDVSADAGGIKLNSVNCSTLNVGTDAGNIKLKSVNSVDIKAKADAGAIKLKNIKTGNIEASTDAGKVSCDAIISGEVVLESDAGSVTASDITADAIHMKSDVGSIIIDKIKGKPTVIDASTNTGSINANLNDIADMTVNAYLEYNLGSVIYPTTFKEVESQNTRKQIRKDNGIAECNASIATNFGSIKIY